MARTDMAHPNHVEVLDGLDRLTVALYRTGVVAVACAVVMRAVTLLTAGPEWLASPVWLLLGVAFSAANLHLYDKRVRWVIGALAWTGAVLQSAALTGVHPIVDAAGTGFLLAAVSGLVLKERFCFRIPGLGLVPIFLAGSLLPKLAQQPIATGALLLPAGILIGVLAVAKLRQPLHFDVGNKAFYQV